MDHNNVKDHYREHLSGFYSWMTGDFDSRVNEQLHIFEQLGIKRVIGEQATDMGCGHGIQSVALARLGYEVTAIDQDEQLLRELALNSRGLNIKPLSGDITDFARFRNHAPHLINCGGDTLAHLSSTDEIIHFIQDCADALRPGGRLVLSFRDYGIPLTGTSRFIPVKSHDTRILTCILEYDETYVTVTDQVYERTHTGWVQHISSYRKTRITRANVITWIENTELSVIKTETLNRMITLLAVKGSADDKQHQAE